MPWLEKMAPPRVYRTEAIVLRRHNLGEADRLLTLYTPNLGKLRAVAAMNKLLHQCFAILRSGKPFDPARFSPQTLDFQYGI